MKRNFSVLFLGVAMVVLFGIVILLPHSSQKNSEKQVKYVEKEGGTGKGTKKRTKKNKKLKK